MKIKDSSKSDKRKVFVGLSGGVDSSVAALLLKKQGFDVTGVYMKNWSDPDDLKTGVCTWIQDRRDAIKVAAHLGIAFQTFDFEKEYRKQVIDYLFTEYEAGRTPNPDILCNKYIKFDLFWKKSHDMGADYIATGHYARNVQNNGEFSLHIPKDKRKDQTYFLYTFTQDQLKNVLFPLSGLKKEEVRAIAQKNNLPTAKKKESMGICFVGDIPIMEFLAKKLPKKSGNVLDMQGNVIGKHDGAYYYTIGQRHGFQLFNKKTDQKACYVVKKDIGANTLTVAEGRNAPSLEKKELKLGSVHWISGQKPRLPVQWKARIRHGQALQTVRVSELPKSELLLQFARSQQGVACGQSVVFYNADEVVGGGIIVSS